MRETIVVFVVVACVFGIINYIVFQVGRASVPTVPMSCPFPLTTDEVQAPQFYRIGTSTDQGPRG